MSLRRKPTLVSFDNAEDKQKFLNWALGPSKSSNGVKKAKLAMEKAKKNIALTSERILPTAHEGKEVQEGGMIYHSKYSSSNRTFLNRKKWVLKREYLKIKKGWE